MRPMAGLQRVVGSTIHRVRECSGTAKGLAPGVCTLEADAGRGPQRDFRLHRMVVGVPDIRLQGGIVKLRVGPDEVLREVVITEDGAIDAGRNRRERGIDAANLAVVQCVQGIGKGDVITIGQVIAELAGGR